MDKPDLEIAVYLDKALMSLDLETMRGWLEKAVARLQSLPQGEAPETPEYAKTHDALFSAIEAGITAVDNSDAGIQTLAAGAAGYVMKRFPGIVLEPQGTARSQEAGTGAPGVRECWVKFVDGAPWAVNIRPYHYMENCEWVRMVEADNQAPRSQEAGTGAPGVREWILTSGNGRGMVQGPYIRDGIEIRVREVAPDKQAQKDGA